MFNRGNRVGTSRLLDAGIDPCALSFKHTKQLWTEWVCRGLSATSDCARLFTLSAKIKVGHSPGHIEPRMRKRRPKPYPRLKVLRAQLANKFRCTVIKNQSKCHFP